MANGKCFKCNQFLDESKDGKRDFRNGVCRLCTLEYQKNHRLKLRNQVLVMFGCKCAKCGNSDVRVLQLDHLHGALEPRDAYMRSGSTLYAALANGRKDPKDFQLLCANCNAIKKFEENEVRGRRSLTLCGRTDKASVS